MPSRLVIGVLGNRKAGKSRTWNSLFGRTVRRGLHRLELRPGRFVEVYLVAASPEEQRRDVAGLLRHQSCRIVLCAMQYTSRVERTLDFFSNNDFFLYGQWLNPGWNDGGEVWDRLGLVNRILSERSALTIRNGKKRPNSRVREIREFIEGWARSRRLIRRS